MRIWAILGLCWLAACAGPRAAQPMVPRTDALTESRELLTLSNDHLRRGDLSAALEGFQQAIDTGVREHDDSTVVQALAQIARIHAVLGDVETAATWLGEAELRATPTDPLGWARYLFAEALWLRALERPDAARQSLERLFSYATSVGLDEVALEAAYELTLQGSPDARITWSQRAIALAESLEDDRWLAVLWNNLGWTLGTAERRDEALEALLWAQHYHELSGGTDLQRLSAHYAVGHAYRMVGDVENAGEWLAHSMRWARERYRADPSPLNAEWYGLCYLEVAELAAELGELDQAIHGFELARQYLLEGGAEERLPSGLQKLEERLQELRALAYP